MAVVLPPAAGLLAGSCALLWSCTQRTASRVPLKVLRRVRHDERAPGMTAFQYLRRPVQHIVLAEANVDGLVPQVHYAAQRVCPASNQDRFAHPHLLLIMSIVSQVHPACPRA